MQKIMLRTIRRRFGISAPRVAVRTHVPWYLRWLGLLGFAVLILAFAWWTYNFGKRFAGFDQSEADQELARLSAQTQTLKQQNAKLGAEVAAADRQLKIQSASYDDLVRQVKALTQENASLKEDLAFFQTLTQPGGKTDGISVNRLKVTQEAIPGEYRYRLLLLHTGQRAKEFQGRLQFLVTLFQDGRRQTITLPDNDVDGGAYRLNFKFYERVDGTFRVAPNALVKSVQIRVYEDGVPQPKLMQTVNLSL